MSVCLSVCICLLCGGRIKIVKTCQRIARLLDIVGDLDRFYSAWLSMSFQGLFVGGVGGGVTEASVATDSALPRHITDRHQPRSAISETCLCCRCYCTTTATVLRPLYRSTGCRRHLQLRTGGFCWCKVLLPACPCWRQPTSAFELGRRRWSSPQQCYLHCLCT